jgi:hypothetical protein
MTKIQQQNTADTRTSNITINQIIQQYLENQEDRLQLDSYKEYRDTLKSYEFYVNQYGPEILSKEELSEFERKSSVGTGHPKQFTEIFGIEMLDRIGWSMYLMYYVPHKILIVTKSDIKNFNRGA